MATKTTKKAVLNTICLLQRISAIKSIDEIAEWFATSREYAEGYKHGYTAALLDVAQAFSVDSDYVEVK